jgi:hypothetical protein
MADEEPVSQAYLDLVQRVVRKHVEEMKAEIGPGVHVIIMAGKDVESHSYSWMAWWGTCNQVVGLYHRTKKNVDAI